MIDNMNRDTPSDEMLVSLADSQPSALRELIRRYEKIIFHMANTLAQNVADAEDYAEEGFLGLIAAVSAFDAEKQVSFKTFAYVCIRHRIRTAYAKRRSDGNVQVISMDDPDTFEESMIADEALSPEQGYLQKERIAELYERMKSVLSKLELEIFSLYVSGYSYAEIAKRMEVSDKTVDNAIARAKRKLRVVWSAFYENE